MKINQIEFEPHKLCLGGKQAVVNFDNGYSASIITGEMFYSSNEKPYEIAVLDGDGITYKTPITDDVLGYLTEEEANEALERIELLPPVVQVH